jgi:hypothetical protein
MGCDGVDWTHLGQTGDLWQVLMDTAVNLLVPKKTGNSLAS